MCRGDHSRIRRASKSVPVEIPRSETRRKTGFNPLAIRECRRSRTYALASVIVPCDSKRNIPELPIPRRTAIFRLSLGAKNWTLKRRVCVIALGAQKTDVRLEISQPPVACHSRCIEFFAPKVMASKNRRSRVANSSVPCEHTRTQIKAY